MIGSVALKDYFLSVLNGFGGSWVCRYQNRYGVKFQEMDGCLVWFSSDCVVDGLNGSNYQLITPKVAFDLRDHNSVVDAVEQVLGHLRVF